MMTGWYRFCQWPVELRDNCLATRGDSDECDATESKRWHNSQFLKCVLLMSWHSGPSGTEKKTQHRQTIGTWDETEDAANINQSNVPTQRARSMLTQLIRQSSHTTPLIISHHWTWFTQCTAIDAYRHIVGIVSGLLWRPVSAPQLNTQLNNNSNNKKEEEWL